ncbi:MULTISPECIES: hypothetical protein [Halobacillus]|uniref:Uncharacterized protein n=1 Tax=Halobacillus halophilus (strain ATCC 35676 / DSM 2266 / JCM 20832 / KCTC 3685 / LMG 17431 / NBRC 102448 / NCIMB 2269) TaxID=866895 RepID=I0JLG6_HALH3|nr:hypothetical protein [Halobacillus halophilus]ASF39098.1 hypothetical protein CEH05_08205 [Halobacillus halophilus]CCG44986.1 hypothetical protein HBHAL_2635 [Halobacillus halophilus DSM 2266]
MASKKEWQVVFLLDSKRVITHELDLSEAMDQREASEFIVKQLDRGSWWFLEDGVVLHTKAVEGFYLEEGADRTDFSRE